MVHEGFKQVASMPTHVFLSSFPKPWTAGGTLPARHTPDTMLLTGCFLSRTIDKMNKPASVGLVRVLSGDIWLVKDTHD